MGIKWDDSDELSKILQDPFPNNRHDIWIWLCLYLYERLDLDRNTCNGFTMREVLAQALRDNPGLVSKIRPGMDNLLLPEDRLIWITMDERQLQWLLARVDELTNHSFPKGLTHLQGRNRLIAMLDVWDLSIEEKALELERLREQWRRHKARDTQFEWFADRKEGIKRCICAWEWIEKRSFRTGFKPNPISNYQELLMFFDEAELSRHEEKVVIQEIKKRWNRQQFDERNADKKQVNVMLSKAVVAQLDALAETHGLKRAQVIESLVRMETDAGTYLANN